MSLLDQIRAMVDSLMRKADEPETVRMLAREIGLIVQELEQGGGKEHPPMRIFSE